MSPLVASPGAPTVGIGAESTVAVTGRYDEELARGGDGNRREGVMRPDVASRVGTAVAVSGTTTVSGLSALAASPFPSVAGFGFLAAAVAVPTLLAAIATLPPTLAVLGRLADRLVRPRRGTFGSTAPTGAG